MDLDATRTFGALVVGRSNERAVTCARRAVGEEGPAPVVVLGPSGSGKSHLLHALGNELVERRPATRVRVTTGEALAHGLVQSYRTATSRSHLAALTAGRDGLFVDAVEDLRGRDATQAFLREVIAFHVERRQPIVLAAGPGVDRETEALASGSVPAVVVRLRRPSLAEKVRALRRTAGAGTLPPARLRGVAREARSIAEARSALERLLLLRALAVDDDARAPVSP